MTQRLYLSHLDTTYQTQVKSCVVQNDGFYAISLEHTIFHPQGGGQPSDKGWISNVEVEKVSILDDAIIHFCKEPIALGQTAIRIHPEIRKLHSQLHSAGHLISHILEEKQWTPIKAHHWPNESRIVFKSKVENVIIPLLTALQHECNDYIKSNLIRHTAVSENGFRKIAFGHFPAYPCGGTHVTHLGEIEILIIKSIQLKKGELMIRYDVS